MNSQRIAQVSVFLPTLAKLIATHLKTKAGESCGFVLVVATGSVAQHISNCNREDSRSLLEGVLYGMDTSNYNTPAHHNNSVLFDMDAGSVEYRSWFKPSN